MSVTLSPVQLDAYGWRPPSDVHRYRRFLRLRRGSKTKAREEFPRRLQSRSPEFNCEWTTLSHSCVSLPWHREFLLDSLRPCHAFYRLQRGTTSQLCCHVLRVLDFFRSSRPCVGSRTCHGNVDTPYHTSHTGNFKISQWAWTMTAAVLAGTMFWIFEWINSMEWFGDVGNMWLRNGRTTIARVTVMLVIFASLAFWSAIAVRLDIQRTERPTRTSAGSVTGTNVEFPVVANVRSESSHFKSPDLDTQVTVTLLGFANAIGSPYLICGQSS
ncbi:hypothetical protein EDD17DRAFT_1524450 [Pisolithus thermaeus]|nr:hypothetical protein EDD17DRAFT_1524450 [Pisolithus thermaeus]